MKTARLSILVGLCVTLLVATPTVAEARTGAVPPVSGRVARGFDPPDRPWLAGHRGVDLLSQPGAPVRAAMSGRITFAAELAGRGVVVVSHGELRTTYEPVTASVSAGELVSTGAVIGSLQAGHTCPGGSCLHWGLRRGEEYLDPLSLLDPAPLRLLPRSAFDALPTGPWYDFD